MAEHARNNSDFTGGQRFNRATVGISQSPNKVNIQSPIKEHIVASNNTLTNKQILQKQLQVPNTFSQDYFQNTESKVFSQQNNGVNSSNFSFTNQDQTETASKLKASNQQEYSSILQQSYQINNVSNFTASEIQSKNKINSQNLGNTEQQEKILKQSTMRQSNFQDVRLSKIQDLSKQIDFLSKEYLERERESEQKNNIERQQFQQLLMEKLEEIEKLKNNLRELQVVKQDKQELELKVTTLQQINQQTETKLINVQSQLNQQSTQRLELEKELNILKMHLETNEKQNQQLFSQNSQLLQLKEQQDQNIAELNFKLNNLTTENEKYILVLEEKQQTLEQIYKKSQEENSLHISELTEKNKSINEKNRLIEDLQMRSAQIISLQSESKCLNEQLRTSFTKIAELETKKSQLENDKAILSKQNNSQKVKIDDLEAKYSFLLRENEYKCQQVMEQQKDLEQFKQEVQQIRVLEYEKKRVSETAEQYLTQAMDLENRVNSLQSQNEKLQILNSEQQQEISSWKSKYSYLEEGHYTALEDAKKQCETQLNYKIQELTLSFETVSAQKSQLLEELSTKSRENEQLKYDNYSLQKVKEEKQKMQQKIDMLQNQIDLLIQDKSKLDLKIDDCLTSLQLKEKSVKDIKIQADQEKYCLEQKYGELQKENEIIKARLLVQQSQLDERGLLDQEFRHSQIQLSEQENRMFGMQEEIKILSQFKEKYEQAETLLRQVIEENQSYKLKISENDSRYNLLNGQKISMIKDIDQLRAQYQDRDMKLAQIQCDYQALIQESEKLNQMIYSQKQELENQRLIIKNYEKNQIFQVELENKLSFLQTENERLNRILINRNNYMY